MTDYDRLDDLYNQIDGLEMGLLSRTGWRHTSATPLFVWMWEKEINGHTYMVTRSVAVQIQAALDNQPAPNQGDIAGPRNA